MFLVSDQNICEWMFSWSQLKQRTRWYATTVLHLSLYSSIGDFFMIWRLIKNFKSNIVLSVGFDYDIGVYYV